jgi:DNA-binding response OmpR family regulator
MKILIVEDEPALRESIVRFLETEGYLCESAADLFTAEDKLASHPYDLILLDITLPDGNGLDLLDFVRAQHPETGVLILSARNSLDDKVRGLDLGADDYLTKPFHLAELNSRIKALIRRKQFQGNNVLRFQEISLDLQSMEVRINQQQIQLTKKEYDLLVFFLANTNRVLTREAIAEHIWGDMIDQADNFDFIYTHIKNLRKKIEAAGGKDYLHTVYGAGYKFSEG